jgi:hypothetical protein
VNVVLHPMGRFGHHITRAEKSGAFFKQKSYIRWHRSWNRSWNGLKFFRLGCGQNSRGGGSKRDLVLLFAFVGRMPGFPFSCVVAEKWIFCLSQRFVQFAS